MKITAYDLYDGNWEHGITIEPAPATRSWMPRFSYWCTPMVIANQYGWNVVSSEETVASWDSGTSPESVHVERGHLAKGHFGSGVLTFQLPFLFRTPPGWSLHVRGPINEPRDGIAPLEGLVETDITAETFTMNWLFTRPGTVTFAAGDAICTVLPVERGQLQRFDFLIESIEQNEELRDAHRDWSTSRAAWNSNFEHPHRKHGDYAKRIEERALNLARPVETEGEDDSS